LLLVFTLDRAGNLVNFFLRHDLPFSRLGDPPFRNSTIGTLLDERVCLGSNDLSWTASAFTFDLNLVVALVDEGRVEAELLQRGFVTRRSLRRLGCGAKLSF